MKLNHKQGGSHYYAIDGSPRHDADLRVARKEGLFPSVTNVLGAWEKPFLVNYKVEKAIEASLELVKGVEESTDDFMQRVLERSWEHAEQAANTGNEVHDELEEWNKTWQHPEPYTFKEQFAPHCQPWVQYARTNLTQIISPERVLVNKELAVAGTTDLIAVHKDYGLTVFDYKTTKVKLDKKKGTKKPAFYDNYIWQLAAYAEMYRLEQSLPTHPRVISIVIDLDVPGLYEKVWDVEEQAEALEFFRALLGAWKINKNFNR